MIEPANHPAPPDCPASPAKPAPPTPPASSAGLSSSPAGPPPPLTFGQKFKIGLAWRALALLARILGPSMRLRAHHYGEFDAARDPKNRGLLFAVWHGDHFPFMYAYRGEGVCCITSHSADGEILTRILLSLGYTCVRGSSSRGGARALIDLARIVRTGVDTGIALDGPKGPRRVAKPGIVRLAKITGCPIIPTASAMDRYWEFRSWDRFRIPKPFCRCLILSGAPIHVPPDADEVLLEQKRQELERVLLQLQELVEKRVTQPGTEISLTPTDHTAERL